jgi:hypothetical protein
MIFRADPSAVRFERGGRVGVSMFKVLETQGSIGNDLLCALQKNLRVFVYEKLVFTLEEVVYECDQRIDYSYFPTSCIVSLHNAR